MKKTTQNKKTMSSVLGWLLFTAVLLGLTVSKSNAQCADLYTVTMSTVVSGTFNDEGSWQIRNSVGTVVATGGPYGGAPGTTFNGTYTANGISPNNGPFTFWIETQGAFADNVVTWSVSTSSCGVLVSGTTTAGQALTSSAAFCCSGGGSGPANDACAGAITVANPSTTNGTTVGATADVTACATFTSRGIWYAVVGDGQEYTASLCGSAYDTWISVYSGTCAGLTCIVQNDDFCNLQSQASWCTNAGTTYYILVNGFNTASGAFTMAMSKSAAAASASPTTVCAGTASTLTGTGATAYSWNPGGLSGASVSVTPSTTTTYTLSATVNACTVTRTTTVTVNQLPAVSANASDASICAGDAEILTGGGAVSYTWTGGVSDGTSFNPAGTATYTVTGTDANTCVNTASVTVTVNSLPTVTANASATTVCAGDMETLTGSGTATSYAWDNGVTDAVAFATTSTTTYMVTGTDGNGCMNMDMITVTVNSLPTVTANASATSICMGDMETLTGSGTATSYTWDNGVTDALAFSPAGTTTYMVTGTDGNGCMNMDMVTVTVNSLPTVTANASATTICMGDMETLTGSGTATSYTWDNGVTDALAFSPAGTTTYMVTGTDGNGCMNMDMITVTVNALPTVTANASATTICMGDMETLTGSGTATSYTWDNGVTDALAFSPAGTTTYMVTGTDGNGCVNMDMITVTVNSLPTVTANASATTVCAGDMETLTGSGTATSYAWDNGVTDAVAFATTTTTTYMVTGTDGNGCMNMDMTTVTVNALPTVTANASASSICMGDSETLTGSGTATSYTWDNGVTDALAFTPAGTATYMITGTDGNGCTNTDMITVTVNALPTVTYTETMTMVCENWAAFTLAAGAPAGGVYSGNSVTGSSFDPTAAGAGTFTITYTYTDGNTCSSFATSDIVVDACTGVTANGSLSSLVVYPNPSTGVYYITIDKATKVTIYNTLGEMVYDKEMNVGNNEIDMNGFANGMYSLKAVQGNNQQTIHLIKN